MADQNQTSLGLTTRFLNESGNQTLSTSIGKAFYHNHRKVQLPDDENDYFQLDTAAASSSLMTNTQWRPNPDMELSHFMEWDQQDSFSRQQRFAVNYQPVLENQHQLKLVNMGLNQLQYIDPDTETPKEFLYQLDTSLFWSINDSWAISGRLLRDLKSYDSDERRPASPVLESLAGIEYQNCCWRFQLTYREYSKTNNDDPVYSTDKRYNFMFSIQLKGLTTLGGSTDDLLKSSIPGYSRRTYHDY